MDIYIQLGMLQKAHKMLTLNTKQLKQNKRTAVIYNLLMKVYVSNAELDKLLEVYKLMKTHSVQPDTETYTLLFQTIVNMKSHKKRAGEYIGSTNIDDELAFHGI